MRRLLSSLVLALVLPCQAAPATSDDTVEDVAKRADPAADDWEEKQTSGKAD